MKRSLVFLFASMLLAGPALAQPKLEKFPFRLNWTLYGEHAPFFVARDKGFYAQEGLEVEIQEGSGSTTVSQLVANATSPVAYVDAATMMRGVGAGMPIKAVGVTLQQSPMAFIYRADAARPTKISEIKGSRIAITAGDASLAIFTAFMGTLGMKLEDVQMITVANPAAKSRRCSPSRPTRCSAASWARVRACSSSPASRWAGRGSTTWRASPLYPARSSPTTTG